VHYDACNLVELEAAIAACPLAEVKTPPVETERQIYGVNAGTAPRVARLFRETIRRRKWP
jgi:hypothetical protein